MIDMKKLGTATPAGVQMDLPQKALELWNPKINAADSDDKATITILDVIGFDYWEEGVTAKRIAAALRNIGAKNPVTVYINSPGGDMFEGIAIHNLLAAHQGKVTVVILGLAASAASIIAMAGSEIRIAQAAFIMIHNAWMIAAGNKEDFREAAAFLEPFDAAIADLYASRTGLDSGEIAKMMKKETWLGTSEAIEKGFADSESSEKLQETEKDEVSGRAALRKVDNALAQAGITRKERRELLSALKPVTPSADGDLDTPSAVDVGELVSLTNQMKELLLCRK